MSRKNQTVDGTFKAEVFRELIDEIVQSESLTAEEVKEILEECIARAYKDYANPTSSKNASDMIVKVELDLKTTKGKIKIYECKNIVKTDDDITDDFVEIDLESAREYSKKYKVGELCKMPIGTDATKEFFSNQLTIRRIAQSFRQKITEATKKALLSTYAKLVGKNIYGTVERIEANKNVVLNFGNASSILTSKNSIPNETFKVGQTNVPVLLEKVGENGQQSRLIISRTSKNFVKNLLEKEIPEIYDGSVIIKEIARRPGVRSKVVVTSAKENIDALGSCIGSNSHRTATISNLLNGEKIDIIKYEEDPRLMLIEALKPAEIIGIKLPDDMNDKDSEIIAICNNGAKKQAIGKDAVNVVLAGLLLNNMKVKVYETDEAMREGIHYETKYQINHEVFEKSLKETTKAQETVTTKQTQTTSDSSDYSYSYTRKNAIQDLGNTYDESTVVYENEENEAKEELKVEEPTLSNTTEDVEHVEIKGTAKFSLDDYEKMIESEKNSSKKQQTTKKNNKKDSNVNKVEEPKQKEEERKSNVENLPIYSDEEYDDYDEYDDEDEDKYSYSEEDEEYDDIYNN